jgi:aldose 1-epimerase
MRFTIDRYEENGLSLIRLTDRGNQTAVCLLPDHGALLHSLTVATNSGPVNIIDNYASAEILKNELGLSYKGAKLSPFACRIPGGRYRLKNKSYEISKKFIDGSAIHGLLYDKPFSIMEEYADNFYGSVVLNYHYDKDDEGYPFEYDCKVSYRLFAENKVDLETVITNVDHQSIPIADGWHPYFQLGRKDDEWIMQISSEACLEFNDELIPTGRILPYPGFAQATPIGETQLDHCFVLEIREGVPVCVLLNPENGLKLSFFAGAEYPYLLVYIPEHRTSMAIENLSAAPDCFNNGMGLILLPPGQFKTFNLSYEVSVV